MVDREGRYGRRSRTHFTGLVLLWSLSSAGTALAQTGADRAAAQALYDDARKLVQDGKFAEACPKFEESQKLDPGFGTAFFLADCWQHVGKTASAWALYLDVAAGTKAAGQTDRAALARSRADALVAKLSKLTITVADPVPSIRVERDGEAIGRAIWGSAVPVDPGEHRIRATADGKKVWEKTVNVSPDGASESVTVPALEDVEAKPAAAPPPVVAPSQTPEEDHETSRAKSLSHEGQLGTFLRADGAGIGFFRGDGTGKLVGPSPAVGVTYGVAPFMEVGLGAILGDGKGFEPHGTFLVLPGELKPRITVAVPVLFIEGARGGIRGAVGAEWDPSRNMGVFLDLGAAYFFTMPPGYDKFALVPSLGMSLRL